MRTGTALAVVATKVWSQGDSGRSNEMNTVLRVVLRLPIWLWNCRVWKTDVVGQRERGG